jgi:hypothetical protein
MSFKDLRCLWGGKLLMCMAGTSRQCLTSSPKLLSTQIAFSSQVQLILSLSLSLKCYQIPSALPVISIETVFELSSFTGDSFEQ